MKLNVLAALLVVSCVATACAGAAAPGGVVKDQSLEVIGKWSGDEQEAFEAVLEEFNRRTGARARYTSAGDELPSVLRTRVQGGIPPSVALVAQPGLIAELARTQRIRPANDVVTKAVGAHYSPAWQRFASVDGVLYAVPFKAANKSLVWFNKNAFELAGVSVPKTWQEFIQVSRTIAQTGRAAVSLSGKEGWTLTDWFENVYLRSAGPEMYDKLSRHEIAWTDLSVKQSLEVLAQLFGEQKLIEGGTAGALNTGLAESVIKVFGERTEAAMVFEGDFAATPVRSAKARFGEEAATFPFPSVNGSESAVLAGGDFAVQFKADDASSALMTFLASPEAAAIWAAKGGFLSANRDIDAGAYPDEMTRGLAEQITHASESIRFDMSDLAPVVFGSTAGAGVWKDLQDFLGEPGKIEEAMKRLESNASKAYSK
jgi:alpha-glucoside transport system substrate-binding protein